MGESNIKFIGIITFIVSIITIVIVISFTGGIHVSGTDQIVSQKFVAGKNLKSIHTKITKLAFRDQTSVTDSPNLNYGYGLTTQGKVGHGLVWTTGTDKETLHMRVITLANGYQLQIPEKLIKKDIHIGMPVDIVTGDRYFLTTYKDRHNKRHTFKTISDFKPHAKFSYFLIKNDLKYETHSQTQEYVHFFTGKYQFTNEEIAEIAE